MDFFVLMKPCTTNVSHITFCLVDINNCMSEGFLQINDSKSEIVIITMFRNKQS